MGMHKVAGSYELHHEEASLWLSESASSAEHVHQALWRIERQVEEQTPHTHPIVAQLESHINIIIILKTLVELYNIWMLQ